MAKERTLKSLLLSEDLQAVNGSWRDVFSSGTALLSFPYPSKQPLTHAPISNPNSTQWITERRGRRKEGGERERRRKSHEHRCRVIGKQKMTGIGDNGKCDHSLMHTLD